MPSASRSTFVASLRLPLASESTACAVRPFGEASHLSEKLWLTEPDPASAPRQSESGTCKTSQQQVHNVPHTVPPEIQSLVREHPFVPILQSGRGNDDLTLLHEREPRDQRGELFVLRPRGTKRAAEIGEATNKRIRLQGQSVFGPFEQFPLLSSERLEAAALACVEQRFAKKCPVLSVNQRIRCENFGDGRK